MHIPAEDADFGLSTRKVEWDKNFVTIRIIIINNNNIVRTTGRSRYQNVKPFFNFTA